MAIIGSDMQEVIGTAIALYLLSNKAGTERERENDSAFLTVKGKVGRCTEVAIIRHAGGHRHRHRPLPPLQQGTDIERENESAFFNSKKVR